MKTQIFDDIVARLWEIRNRRDAEGLPIILLREPVLVLHPQARYDLMSDERLNWPDWNPVQDTIFRCEVLEDRFMEVGTWKLEIQEPLPGFTSTR